MPRSREIEANTIGGRLRAARLQKKLTLAAIGKHLGISAQAVAQWEYGQAEPSLDKLMVLVQLLELHLADVLGMHSNGHSKVSEIAERLELVLEILPSAQPAIIDTSVKSASMDGVYVVRLRKGDRTKLLGRVVWPKI
jgi:transcriptional regulator with XRE-family HTH domain